MTSTVTRAGDATEVGVVQVGKTEENGNRAAKLRRNDFHDISFFQFGVIAYALFLPSVDSVVVGVADVGVYRVG